VLAKIIEPAMSAAVQQSSSFANILVAKMSLHARLIVTNLARLPLTLAHG